MTQRTVLLGPPGTGKTTALMAIVGELLAEGYQPHEIAFVSYSRAAVHEACERVAKATGIEADRWSAFRTLHSTWSRLQGLRKEHFLTGADLRLIAEGGGDAFDLDGRDEASEDAYLDAEERSGSDAQLRAALDWCRATMRPAMDGAQRLRNPMKERRRYLRFCEAYADLRDRTGKLDHTDILEQALHDRLVIPCRVLIVDEAQDLSPLQEATLRGTIDNAEKVWVAGDDDQAIYEFQGASPRWLISLTRDPAWTTRVLDRSWRCPEEVRGPAQRIAERLTERATKAYRSRDGSGGYRVGLTAQEALAPLLDGSRSSFALARTRKGCVNLASMMRAAGAPYVSERGGRSPLDPKGLRGLVDALHAVYAAKPMPASTLAAAFTSPVCPGERGKERTGVVAHGGKAAIKAWGERLGDAEVVLDRATANELGLDRAYSTDPWELLASVRAWPEGAGDAKGDLTWLRSLWQRNGRAWPAHVCVVTTWHGSKGREADVVVIDPALPWPAARALAAGGETADTEHRCAYVALTRARREAVVLEDDPRAHGCYQFPTPVRVAARYPAPAASWTTYGLRDAAVDDTLDALLADIAAPHGLTGLPAFALAWAWHGWRDLFESTPLYGRDAVTVRRAAASMPPVVASRLAEVTQ